MFKKGVFNLIIVCFIVISLSPGNAKATPDISAYSGLLMDQDSGRILFAKKPHEKQRIASITKIMTAIIALEFGNLGDDVKISNRAVNVEGSSIYLEKDTEITLEDLLYGLMLRSGNDAAIAIAEHIGGSLDGFVYLMNEKALQLGMKNTSFANPHGLDDSEEHYSTPFDMGLLTKYAMQNESFRKISSTKKYKTWYNKNRLLTEKYKYCTGGKTGFTKRANRTLVTTASKNNLNLIAVTLNGPDDWNDHINLYEYSFNNYHQKEILRAGIIKAIPKTIFDRHVVLKRSFTYPLTSKENDYLSVQYKIISPTVELAKPQLNRVVGMAEIYFKDELIGQLPIYLNEKVKEKHRFWQLFTKFVSLSLGSGNNG